MIFHAPAEKKMEGEPQLNLVRWICFQVALSVTTSIHSKEPDFHHPYQLERCHHPNRPSSPLVICGLDDHQLHAALTLRLRSASLPPRIVAMCIMAGSLLQVRPGFSGHRCLTQQRSP